MNGSGSRLSMADSIPSPRATIPMNGQRARPRSTAQRLAVRGADRDRRGPPPPGVLLPEPADGHDRDDRVRHGLHAGPLPPGPAREAVDPAHPAEDGGEARLPVGDPLAPLRSAVGDPRDHG